MGPTDQRSTTPAGRYGPRLPRSLAQAKQWLSDHHMTLMAIADTPHSIALGSAIGIFFGFTPLYPVKTVLSVLVAWLCRCSKVAALIAVTVHDIAIFVMPAIYFAQYKLGCWVLQRSPPAAVGVEAFQMGDLLHWRFLLRVVWPAVIGSLFFAVPSALITYFLLRMLVRRARGPERNATS